MSQKTNTNKREHKGTSLIEFPEDYIILDLETSDINYFYGAIIEVAAKKYVNHKLDSSFISLINPGREIPSFITSLTDISNEMVADAPYFSQIAEDLHAFLGDSTLMAHNANFDINFLYDSFYDLNLLLTNDFVDTLRLARILVKDSENHKLKTLAKHFNISLPTHRAEVDVDTTKILYENLIDLNLQDPTVLESFLNLQKRRNAYYPPSIDFREIVSQLNHEDIDAHHPFFKKNICFSGKLEWMSKVEAAQIVANLGAKIQNNITTSSHVLVYGNLDYQIEKYGKKSSKHRKAEELQSKGYKIEIMSEITFMELLDL